MDLLEAKGNIHHFFANPITGETTKDEDGEPYLGFYFELVSLQGEIISPLMGPYNTADEAEIACKTAWEKGDY